jgi:hypothetical protein
MHKFLVPRVRASFLSDKCGTTVLAVHFLSILVKDDPRKLIPKAATGPSQAFADTPIGQSLLKLDESQRKRLESLFNTAYGVVKAGKTFSDYELNR